MWQFWSEPTVPPRSAHPDGPPATCVGWAGDAVAAAEAEATVVELGVCDAVWCGLLPHAAAIIAAAATMPRVEMCFMPMSLLRYMFEVSGESRWPTIAPVTSAPGR